MRNALAFSVLFHVAIVVAAWLGLPHIKPDIGFHDVPVMVEIITIADETNVPKAAPKKPEPKKTAPKPEPKPKPVPKAAPKAPPKPEPAPKPEPEAVAIAEPQPRPKAKKPEPKPEPKPKPKPKPEAKTPLTPAPKPEPEPKATSDFSSVLKTLETMESEPDPKPEEPDFKDMMASALDTPVTPREDMGPQLSLSEIDAVRQQIARCWSLPAGAKDAHEMIIELRVAMNPDATVQAAQIVGSAAMTSDPFYRAMAESALRAVLNPACSPLRLPSDKYNRWRDLHLTFNPKEMFGL